MAAKITHADSSDSDTIDRDTVTRLTTIEGAATPVAPAPSPVDTEVLVRHHPKLDKFLNFQAILPYLNRHGLLPPNQQQEFVSPLPPLVHGEMVNKLLVWLPRNDPGYLREFIQCLRESSEEAGDAHTQLADSLEVALDHENQQVHSSATAKTVMALPMVGMSSGRSGSQTEEPLMEPKVKSGHSKWKKYCPTPCICCYAVMAALFVIALLPLIIVSQIPAAEDNVRPPYAACNDTVELQFNLDNQWLDSATISVSEPYAAKLFFIHGLSCRDLPTIHVICNGTNPGPSMDFVYMLPGSAIHFTIPENADTPVWIFTDSDEADRYYEFPETYNCQQHSSGSLCFEARLHHPVYIYNVTRPAYYFIRWLHRSGINFAYEEILYDFEQISTRYEHAGVSVVPYTLDFGPDFNFEQSCTLLHVNVDTCSNPGYGRVHVSDVERRQDVLLFPALLLIIWLLTLVICIVVHCVYVWWDNKNSTYVV